MQSKNELKPKVDNLTDSWLQSLCYISKPKFNYFPDNNVTLLLKSEKGT